MFSFFLIYAFSFERLTSKVGTFLLSFLAENPLTVLFLPFAIEYGVVEIQCTFDIATGLRQRG